MAFLRVGKWIDGEFVDDDADAVTFANGGDEGDENYDYSFVNQEYVMEVLTTC